MADLTITPCLFRIFRGGKGRRGEGEKE